MFIWCIIFIPDHTGHIRQAWSSHGSSLGKTKLRQNTHGEAKRACHATEAYQENTIRYLPYSNTAK